MNLKHWGSGSIEGDRGCRLEIKCFKVFLECCWRFTETMISRECRQNLSLSVSLTFSSCLGGAVVRRRTRDRKVASSTPGRGAIKSTRSTQSSKLSGVGKSSTNLHGWG